MDWILISGASRGIGALTALKLASKGYSLILWARTEGDLNEIAEKCRSFGVDIRVAIVDISVPELVKEAAELTLSDLNSLRAVILNAGGATFGKLADFSNQEWKNVISTNLDGAFYTLKVTLSLLEKNQCAQLISLGSQSALFGFETQAGYCASKSGLSGLIEVVRRETREKGIRVTNLILSGVDSYFRDKKPGDREGALEMSNVSDVISYLFDIPSSVEIREIQMASIKVPFGPFIEKY